MVNLDSSRRIALHPSSQRSVDRWRTVTYLPKIDPPAMEVPSDPGRPASAEFATLDDTDTTHAPSR